MNNDTDMNKADNDGDYSFNIILTGMGIKDMKVVLNI